MRSPARLSGYVVKRPAVAHHPMLRMFPIFPYPTSLTTFPTCLLLQFHFPHVFPRILTSTTVNSLLSLSLSLSLSSILPLTLSSVHSTSCVFRFHVTSPYHSTSVPILGQYGIHRQHRRHRAIPRTWKAERELETSEYSAQFLQ